MKYKCLILDHDDTAVDSTPEIHHPAHIESMMTLRPDIKPLSIEEWQKKNFSPGIMEYFIHELGLSPEEIEVEIEIWRKHVKRDIPSFFPGFVDILKDFHKQGGIITVVSHSEKPYIQRDYDAAGIGDLVQMIFGWESDRSLCKPNPYPVEQILKEFNLDPSEALIVDDLKPAVDMSKASGVGMVAAGWSHQIKEIQDYMLENTLGLLNEVQDLRKFLNL